MKEAKARRKRAGAAARPAPRPELPLRKKLLFSAVTVVLVLGALEIGARLFVQLAPNSRWESHRQLVDAVGFSALNEILVPDAELFWTFAPNVDHKVISGRIGRSTDLSFTVSTDAHGARRQDGVAGARQQVVFLGDSTTFGLGVDDGQTFGALLQQRLAGTQGVNLGVPGYSAYQGLLRLRRHPFDAPPAAVVVDFGFNDAAAWDNLSDLEHEGRLWAQRSWLAGNSRLVAVLGGLLRRAPAEPDAAPGARRPRLTDEEFAAQLRAIETWCRDRRAVPVLLVWPVRGQLQRDEPMLKQAVVRQVAAANHVRVVDLVPAFRAQGGPGAFLDVVHASRAGHILVADMLEPVLREALAGRE
jgi:lysophospholipase L1-like esterase